MRLRSAEVHTVQHSQPAAFSSVWTRLRPPLASPHRPPNAVGSQTLHCDLQSIRFSPNLWVCYWWPYGFEDPVVQYQLQVWWSWAYPSIHWVKKNKAILAGTKNCKFFFLDCEGSSVMGRTCKLPPDFYTQDHVHLQLHRFIKAQGSNGCWLVHEVA